MVQVLFDDGKQESIFTNNPGIYPHVAYNLTRPPTYERQETPREDPLPRMDFLSERIETVNMAPSLYEPRLAPIRPQQNAGALGRELR